MEEKIDNWVKRMLKSKNGDNIFRGMVTQGLRQRAFEANGQDQELEQGQNTGIQQELVAGHEDLTEKRSIPVMTEQEMI